MAKRSKLWYRFTLKHNYLTGNETSQLLGVGVGIVFLTV